MRRARILACVLAGMTVLAVVEACKRERQTEYQERLENGRRRLAQGEFPEAVVEFKAAVRLAPASADAHYWLGVAQLAAGSPAEAVRALVRAGELDPKHAGTKRTLAQLLSNSQDPEMLEQARGLAQEAVRAQPEASENLTVLALAESRLGDTRSAQKHLNEALRLSPSNLLAASLAARLKAATGDMQGAEQVLKEAVGQAGGAVEGELLLAEFYLGTGRTAEAEQQLRSTLVRHPGNVPAKLALASLLLSAGRASEAEQLYKEAAGQGGPRYRHLYAVFLANQGRTSEAVHELEKLHRADGSDRQVRSLLVAAYVAAGRVAQAQALLEEALKKNPRDTDALLQRAELELSAGDLGRAQARLLEVLRYKPDLAAAHWLVARVYERRGESRLQRQHLEQALSSRPEWLALRLELVRAMANAGALQAALDVVEKAPPSQRLAPETTAAKASLLLGLGRLEEAEGLVREALRRWKSADLLALDGEVKLRRQQLRAAGKAFEEALKLNPENQAALGGMFRTLVATGGTSGALRWLEEYASAHPRAVRVQLFLGERFVTLGRWGQAREAFRRALQVNPRDIEAEIGLARVELGESKLEEARSRLERAEKEGTQQALVQRLLAILESAAGNPDKAIRHYRRAVELEPRDVASLANLAYLLAEYKGQEDEALNYAQRAKESDPRNGDAAAVLGWLYYRKGLYESAVRELEAAVKQPSPESAAAFKWCYLGLSYIKLGRREVGEAALKKALATGLDARHRPAAELALRTIRAEARPEAKP